MAERQSSHKLRQRWTALCCWILALTVHVGAYGQGKVFASFKPELVETGDTFLLSLLVSETAVAPKNVDFAPWADVFPSENILRRSEWKHVGPNWIQQFTLIYFDSAALTLPPLTVFLSSGKTLTSNAPEIKVFPTRGGDISEMEPVREIYRESEQWIDYWPWGLGALLLLSLFFWWLRPRKRPTPAAAIPAVITTPPPSAIEKALAQLSHLEQQQLWKQGKAKEHQAALSLIIREFLENQFKIPALESTTREILQHLSAATFPAEMLPQLKELLQKTDLVKYAQSDLQEAEHLKMLEKARELVAPTRAPLPPTQPAVTTTGKYQPL